MVVVSWLVNITLRWTVVSISAALGTIATFFMSGVIVLWRSHPFWICLHVWERLAAVADDDPTMDQAILLVIQQAIYVKGTDHDL